MTVIDGRSWMEILSPAQCWALLASAPIGRVGVLVDSAPEIYPVNYVVDDRSIVFRTDSGTKLHGVYRSPSVCFEVDGIDVDNQTGWSVLVKGRAIQLSSSEDLRRAQKLPLHFWARGEKAHWIRIVPAQVTGRRIWPGRRTDRGDLPTTPA